MGKQQTLDLTQAELLMGIVSRISDSEFYLFCRCALLVEESDISLLKLHNQSTEDKYQFVASNVTDKKTPQEIYKIVENKKLWSEFIKRHASEVGSLVFSGNTTTVESKMAVLLAWLWKRGKETEEESAIEELCWMVDDFATAARDRRVYSLSDSGVKIRQHCVGSNSSLIVDQR